MVRWASRPALRWFVPLAVVGVILGGTAVTSAVRAAAGADLPGRSAAQLLADLRLARLDGATGTVVEHADLGLPALPNGIGGDGSAEFDSLIAGAHTMRVWYSGPLLARVALVGALGESDVIRNNGDLWIWSSTDNTATHVNVPTVPGPTSRPLPSGLPSALASKLPLTPLDAANDVIAAISPTTSITAGSPVGVADRAAYQLIITPKDPASLVGSVRIALDAQRHIPLRVQIYAAGKAKPAFEIGFTEVSFTRPDPDVFRFNPPPGAKITQAGTGAGAGATHASPTHVAPPRVLGSGWTAVLDATLPTSDTLPGASPNATGGQHDGTFDSLLTQLPTVRGGFGSGKLLSTALFSALLTDDGRIFIGSVSPARLVATASTAGK